MSRTAVLTQRLARDEFGDLCSQSCVQLSKRLVSPLQALGPDLARPPIVAPQTPLNMGRIQTSAASARLPDTRQFVMPPSAAHGGRIVAGRNDLCGAQLNIQKMILCS